MIFAYEVVFKTEFNQKRGRTSKGLRADARSRYWFKILAMCVTFAMRRSAEA